MRILFVSSEVYPLIKTGGLADVSGALPAALKELGADVRILIPAYPKALAELGDYERIATLHHIPSVGSVNLLMGKIASTGVTVIAVQCAQLYEREGGIYTDKNNQDWQDNPLRFGTLSYVAALLASSYTALSDWMPDIIHCNDWQTGLAPAYMHYMSARSTGMKQAKSILSIHNMAFQGCYHADWLNALGLPAESYQMNGLEYYGQLSFLKAGIFYSDMLSTVSPTYAKEIQTPEFGFGMQGLLAHRSEQLHGILNGLDTSEWNPGTDPHLVKNYSAKNLAGKKSVKEALQTRLGLPVGNMPLLGVVSRLTYQKGLDMLLLIAQPLLQQGCQIAILGGGDHDLENRFKQLAMRFPQQISVTIGYNEPLSHQMMAGVDIFVMPSRFEPCGLNQMYGLRYGTPPVVTNTGGLADSVTDSNEDTLKNGTATGFVINKTAPDQLFSSIKRAIAYYQQPEIWKKIQQNGMQKPLDWDQSAKKYLALYQQMLS